MCASHIPQPNADNDWRCIPSRCRGGGIGAGPRVRRVSLLNCCTIRIRKGNDGRVQFLVGLADGGNTCLCFRAGLPANLCQRGSAVGSYFSNSDSAVGLGECVSDMHIVQLNELIDSSLDRVVVCSRSSASGLISGTTGTAIRAYSYSRPATRINPRVARSNARRLEHCGKMSSSTGRVPTDKPACGRLDMFG